MSFWEHIFLQLRIFFYVITKFFIKNRFSLLINVYIKICQIWTFASMILLWIFEQLQYLIVIVLLYCQKLWLISKKRVEKLVGKQAEIYFLTRKRFTYSMLINTYNFFTFCWFVLFFINCLTLRNYISTMKRSINFFPLFNWEQVH